MKDETTIKEAKDAMRPLLRKGCTCPVCGQGVKLYARPLTSAMAAGLILLFKAERDGAKPGDWIHLENFFKSQQGLPASIRGDVPKLRFWGLIEPMPGKREDGNPSNGYYRITGAGMRFAEGRETVMSHIQLYNNKAYGYPAHAKPITIEQALKNKFNFLELMKG